MFVVRKMSSLLFVLVVRLWLLAKYAILVMVLVLIELIYLLFVAYRCILVNQLFHLLESTFRPGPALFVTDDLAGSSVRHSQVSDALGILFWVHSLLLFMRSSILVLFIWMPSDIWRSKLLSP